ncbi:HAD family hydrolase [Cohnella cellulosilytica]|uniref:HAD family hydrolase n=1 Tax=Cohnella cellulosilytica TaxID=986710 RepID=A0ABW2FE58_9BACL
MRKIRLVVSDLDGTLLDESHRLSDELMDRVRTYTKQGGLFTIATGRNWYATKRIVEQTSIHVPVILCNGAVLADPSTIYYESGLATDVMADLLIEAGNSGIAVLLFEHNNVFGFGSEQGINRFCDKEKVNCEVIPARKDELLRIKALKAVLVGPYELSLSLWHRHRMDVSGQNGFIRSEEDFFEIVKKGENKGKTMLKLAERLGIPKEEILAIGNHMNDKEMLTEAGIGAAVSNSYPELLNYADFVCEHGWDKGVIETMDRFCRIC